MPTLPSGAPETLRIPLPGARAGRDPARAIKRGPSRIPPEVVAATQRDRLFDALVHTVAQKGYANARVSDICQAAGVTRPAFYALFQGKDDAFLATYRHGTELLLDLMEVAYRDATDWRSASRAALRVLLDVLAAVPAFATMAVVEVEAVGPAARDERNRLLRRFDRFFADAPLRPGLDRPGVRIGSEALAGTDELVASIVGGIYSTIYRYVAAGRVAELPGRLAVLSYFMMVPFVGCETAARELDRELDAVDAVEARASLPCAPGHK